MSRMDAIRALLAKAGGSASEGIGALKGAGAEGLASLKGLGAKASAMGSDAVSGLGGSGQDYLRAGKSMFMNPGPMTPGDEKKKKLIALLGILGLGGAAGGAGYGMMEPDEDD